VASSSLETLSGTRAVPHASLAPLSAIPAAARTTNTSRVPIRKICAALEREYHNPRHGNKRNPLDEIFYIILSTRTPGETCAPRTTGKPATMKRRRRASRLDPLTHAKRSELMSHVRSKDTRPELIVRRLTHTLGFRYRLHSGKLPGRPDLVFATRKKVIFVHGCFWHRHPGCTNGKRTPKSRLAFWIPKLKQNRRRDLSNQRQLKRTGWGVLVLWECEMKDLDSLASRIRAFLKE
jgi:DNA mismatch endonuclease, patch repair protein